MMGKQRLVGGDDVLAGVERGLDGLLGDAVVAADQLDEDVDRRILRQRDRIVDQANAGNIDAAALACGRAPRPRRLPDSRAGARGKLVAARAARRLQQPRLRRCRARLARVSEQSVMATRSERPDSALDARG